MQETRDSQTLGTQILATAVPVRHGARIDGAVRVTQSVDAVHRATRKAILSLALLGGLVLALGVIAGALIARATSRPIRRLEEAARRVEEGDLTATALVEGSSEQRSLAQLLQPDDRPGSPGCSAASRSSSPTPPISCARP